MSSGRSAASPRRHAAIKPSEPPPPQTTRVVQRPLEEIDDDDDDVRDSAARDRRASSSTLAPNDDVAPRPSTLLAPKQPRSSPTRTTGVVVSREASPGPRRSGSAARDRSARTETGGTRTASTQRTSTGGTRTSRSMVSASASPRRPSPSSMLSARLSPRRLTFPGFSMSATTTTSNQTIVDPRPPPNSIGPPPPVAVQRMASMTPLDRMKLAYHEAKRIHLAECHVMPGMASTTGRAPFTKQPPKPLSTPPKLRERREMEAQEASLTARRFRYDPCDTRVDSCFPDPDANISRSQRKWGVTKVVPWH